MRTTAAIIALVGLGFLGGGVYRELRGPGEQAGPQLVRYELPSQLLGRTMREVVVLPRRAHGLVVLLHAQPVRPALLATVAQLGDGAPAVLLVDGSPGRRYGSYVLVEAIPDALERFDLDGPVTAGGRGAPALAGVDPGRVCAARPELELRPLVHALRGCP